LARLWWHRASELRAFETRIRELEADVLTRRHPMPLLLVGSSYIELWTTFREDLQPCEAVNYGVGGSTIGAQQQLMERIVVPLGPECLVVYAGSNDLTGAWLRSQRGPKTALRVLEYLDSVREALPNCRVFYVSITEAPARARAHHEIRLANDLIRRGVASRVNMEFVDTNSSILRAHSTEGDMFREDRLHLNAEGYRVFSSVISSAVMAR
jgi:lysophospholipase L1-like esterase